MKVIHLRYPTKNALVTDVQTGFPNWDGNQNDLPDWLDRHGYIKGAVRDINNVLLGVDLYLLVKDDFILPGWVTGTILIGQDAHEFMGNPPNSWP